MNRPEFHPSSYSYEQSSRELARLDASFFPGHSSGRLEAIREQMGGKGVSLALSEELSRLSPHLRVPTYFPIPQQGTLKERWEHVVRIVEDNQDIFNWVLRSSDAKEDWADGRCGVKQSIKFAHHDRFRIEPMMRENDVYVLQEFVQGIGHVVDIVYSPVLDRP